MRLSMHVIPLVVASALFMHLMDTAALATALPTMARAFHCDPVDLRFALTAYMVTITMLVPASAWLSARIGAKRLFVAAMILFALGSACCALADDVPTLVGARILQGLGGAMMTPVGRTIVVVSLPRSFLVRAMTMFTLPGIVAPLIGPPLAGMILATASWRWIFLINLPVCLVGVIAVIALVPPIEDVSRVRFDTVGYSLIVVAVAALTLLVEMRGFSDIALAGKALLIAGLVLAWRLYRGHARRSAHPILDPALLKIATLRISLAAGMFQRIAVGASPFLLPLLLQSAIGMTALAASQVMIAGALGGLVARFVVPTLLRRMDFRAAMLWGGAATALLSAVPALFVATTPVPVMAGVMVMLGLARSAFFIPVTTITYADLDRPAVGQATVLFTMMQQFSLGLGVTLSALLLNVTQSPGHVLAVEDFALPFSIIAACAALSLVFIWPMRADAGDEMRNR